MTAPVVDVEIELTGRQAERFEETKREIAERRGTEPTDAEIIEKLMEDFRTNR